MLPQSGCIDVSATGRKCRWRASVWHWPREAEQTVAAGFDHDQTLQGGHVGSGATAHPGGLGTRCHVSAAATNDESSENITDKDGSAEETVSNPVAPEGQTDNTSTENATSVDTTDNVTAEESNTTDDDVNLLDNLATPKTVQADAPEDATVESNDVETPVVADTGDKTDGTGDAVDDDTTNTTDTTVTTPATVGDS